ncbi:hypothetical protein Lqui_1189 [Legionella quinlivanii]|uniref:Uncharacterized protein n=2 Tax=Legionella quinlivanii TaxID=45073 RepID=A0A0W0Y5Z1_9GAMM|nr:hypothetical protein [Legionella quinlivanii]KTD52345.1 hypothetical protein Lqui_1189 [Legionella quinlivanii]MCW8449693.1 hypothetical protein [Legionella quinlivanii]SEF71968.1 hypothetical protein SAMN02746093_00860 [Legionella quinlivanii DSM 21216]STY12156.1 Uncharacterised protein [Legionella quinlivanii]
MEKILASLLAVMCCCANAEPLVLISTSDPNINLLPSPFPVYVIEGQAVINHPSPGATKVDLPTDNSYTKQPGCYIACYSHRPGVYAVSPTISVMGQIRVPGTYVARLCQPAGFENQDISKAEQFKQLCTSKISACKGSCWAGGDTGGWFGIQGTD